MTWTQYPAHIWDEQARDLADALKDSAISEGMTKFEYFPSYIDPNEIRASVHLGGLHVEGDFVPPTMIPSSTAILM